MYTLWGLNKYICKFKYLAQPLVHNRYSINWVDLSLNLDDHIHKYFSLKKVWWTCWPSASYLSKLAFLVVAIQQDINLRNWRIVFIFLYNLRNRRIVFIFLYIEVAPNTGDEVLKQSLQQTTIRAVIVLHC